MPKNPPPTKTFKGRVVYDRPLNNITAGDIARMASKCDRFQIKKLQFYRLETLFNFYHRTMYDNWKYFTAEEDLGFYSDATFEHILSMINLYALFTNFTIDQAVQAVLDRLGLAPVEEPPLVPDRLSITL